MDNLKERYEKRLAACEAAIAKYVNSISGSDSDNKPDSHFDLIELSSQLSLYQLDAKYYILELEAQIRANERYIKMLKEDRDEAWRFCKL